MARIACSYCKEKIDIAATRCPRCQGVFSPEDVTARTREYNRNGLFGCGALIVLGGLVAMCSAPATVPETPGPTAKSEALKLIGAVRREGRACDLGYALVGISLMGKDEVVAYRTAADAAAACLGTSSKVSGIEVPTALGKAEYDAATLALKECSSAYTEQWSASETLGKILDGPSKVSARAEFDRAVRDASTAQANCNSQLSAIATKFGATEAEITAATPSS